MILSFVFQLFMNNILNVMGIIINYGYLIRCIVFAGYAADGCYGLTERFRIRRQAQQSSLRSEGTKTSASEAAVGLSLAAEAQGVASRQRRQ